MAIPKQGSRLITVNDSVFRWRVRRKPTYCQGNSWGPMTFAVELADASSRVLLVSLPCSRPDAWLGERTMAIRPALVTAVIRTALGHGWDPQQAGNAFELALTDKTLTELMNSQPPAYDVPSMRR
ncbi:hypothetical protein [Microbispora bryophytorum]|uniref:Uncharacterized protein n=1 Tax=Microbispora bryophytorum TaxID=1460882 RepID=A0A8H9LAF7_9ACTN|nr:hypothetical protein [Microbispora bryophytorum]MBD3137140.1 hypothetical protein [Microbispora bryophytorum]GGO07085.1 hypothetical protein GCM10011574_20250 [Microbispora bryophytorum]